MDSHVASSISAVLGPTNTGKTHRAVERMLAHDTGMMGFPLRLLAREIYDRITARLGESEVALVTGEEKRVPAHPRYWICTVEAMPVGLEVDFLAVDEIQLMSHPERGHVFTDRLLKARGVRETWFLGSDTARSLVERLVPTARLVSHPRLSRLSHAGQSSLGALPPRSGVVAFSATRVYELAERLRQKRGGAAVVLGALSPRARNAQVALYQSGEVDYIVATDAIGMGLNLDVKHIAFADTRKFDGREVRPLEAAELGQIAGRAGRYLADGTFGTLAPVEPLPDSLARVIEGHVFPAERSAFYRNSDLDFSSVPALVHSLRERPRQSVLKMMEKAADTDALAQLGGRSEILSRATSAGGVSLLWDVCRIPDFRELLLDYHVNLLAEVFLQLTGPAGELEPDWMAAQIARVDDPVGDIDTLLMRMASVRTFTYVSHQAGWLARPLEWQEKTRLVEDRLSDALHQRLVARFVDEGRNRRAARPSPRGSRRAPPEPPPPEPRPDHPFGRLLELRESLAKKYAGPPVMNDHDWLDELVAAPHDRFRTDTRGVIHDDVEPIGKLTRGPDLLRPDVSVTLPELGPGDKMRLHRRLVAYGRDLAQEVVAPLKSDALRELTASGRGLVYRLTQHLGTLRMDEGAPGGPGLPARDARLIEDAGVVLGRVVSYLPRMLGVAGVQKRAALLAAFRGEGVPAPEGASSPRVRGVETAVYTALGYPVFGSRAIRADVAERIGGVLDAVGDEPFVPLVELATWLGCPREELESVVAAFGYRALGGGRFVSRAIHTR
jgi:ATP-dependent RNA helicase SUPV3L1/SUV3